MRARTDLALVIGLALAACLFAAVLPSSLAAVRIPLALPLVLVLPGYAVITAIFRPGELRASELLMLSIAISIAATIVTGLFLDVMGVRLTAAPWMDLLAALTLGAAARGTARGHARTLMISFVRPRGLEVGALAMAVVLLGAAAALGFEPLGAPKATQGTSALWLLPAPGGRSAACVGVINEQKRVTTYTVSVAVAGTPAQQFGPIKLAPGHSWTHLVTTASTNTVVKATLRTSTDPASAYRTAALADWNVAVAHC